MSKKTHLKKSIKLCRFSSVCVCLLLLCHVLFRLAICQHLKAKVTFFAQECHLDGHPERPASMWSIKNYASVRVGSMKDRTRAFFAIVIIIGSCALSFYLGKGIFKEYSSFGDEIVFFMVNRCFGYVAFRDYILTGLFYFGSLHGKRVCFQEDGLLCRLFKMGLHCYRNTGSVVLYPLSQRAD